MHRLDAPPLRRDGARVSLPRPFTLLQVAPALDTGGVEQTALDISAAVVAAGGRSLVASRGGRLEPRLKVLGGELVRLPVQSKNPLTMAANALALRRLIVREGVSIVHARSRAPAWSALWAARRARVPFVTTYAGIYVGRSPLKRWYNGVMARGDLVIANSDFTREHLLTEHKIDPARVVTIPRGVDFTGFDPDAVAPSRVATLRAAWRLDARPTLLLAGRLTRWKGHELVIDAVARLRARGVEDFVVVFAGDEQGRDRYRADLEARIERLGLAERIRIVGHCADMPAAYLAADLALAPSLEPEAFGRTAVEPQAMGRPVLAAAHGAPLETVEHGMTGGLVAPGDVEAWADAIATALAAGPDALTYMGILGRGRASGLYSVEAMAAATLEAYGRLLASRASAAR